jgi:hypothetical protein
MTAWLTRRPFASFGLLGLLATGFALALSVLGQASAQTGSTETQKRVIGTAVSNGFRTKVTAIRVLQQGSSPDTATVRIAAFQRSGGSWDRLGGSRTVGQREGWFWNVVTHPYGVRLLALHRPGGKFPSRIALKLLVSPSVGPSGTFRFVIDGGRLVQVDV